MQLVVFLPRINFRFRVPLNFPTPEHASLLPDAVFENQQVYVYSHTTDCYEHLNVGIGGNLEKPYRSPVDLRG